MSATNANNVNWATAPRDIVKRKNPVEYEQQLVEFREMRQRERDKRLEKIEQKKRDLKDRRMTIMTHGNFEPASSNMKFNITEVGQRTAAKSVAMNSKAARPLLSRFSSAVAIQLVTKNQNKNTTSHKSTAGKRPSSRNEIEKSTSKQPASSHSRSVRPIAVPLRRKSLAVHSTVLEEVRMSLPMSSATDLKENSGDVTHLKENPQTTSPRKALKSAVPLATSDEVNGQNITSDVEIDDKESSGRRTSFTMISFKRKSQDPKTPVAIPKQAKFEMQSPSGTITAEVVTMKPSDGAAVKKVDNNKTLADKRLSRLNQLSIWREQRQLKLQEAKSIAASKKSSTGTCQMESRTTCRTKPVVFGSSRKPSSINPDVKSEVIALPQRPSAVSVSTEPIASVQLVKPVSSLKGVQRARTVQSSAIADVIQVAAKAKVAEQPSSRAVNKSSRAKEVPVAIAKGILKPSVPKIAAKKVPAINKDVVTKKKVSTTSVTNQKTRFKGALADINATAARFKAALASKDAHRRFSPRTRPGNVQGPNTSTPFCYNGRRVGGADTVTPWTKFKTPGEPGTKNPTTARVEKTPGGVRWTIKTPATNRLTQNVSSDKVLRENLEKWLTAHGKAASTFRHVGCFGLHGHQLERSVVSVVPQKLSLDSSIENGEILSNLGATETLPAIVESETIGRGSGAGFQTDLLEMLRECLSLMQSGFPSHHLLTWLDDISSRITGVRRTACFWTSKARLTAAAYPGDLIAAVAVLDEGIKCKAEPIEELYLAREELVLQMNTQELHLQMDTQQSELEIAASNNLYQRIAAEVQQKNAFQSSAIKFCMKRVDSTEMPVCTPQKTPVARRRTVAFPTTPSSPPRQNNIVTPVRRSTRKSYMQLPVGLRDHDIIIESLDELTTEARDALKFNTNVALTHDMMFDPSEADVSGIALL